MIHNIFISECGNFVALRVPGIQPNFDVWRHDSSEMWEGERYVELPYKKESYNPRRLYTDKFTHPKKIVGSYSNIKKGFEVILHDLEIKKSITIRFNTPTKSLSSYFAKRRKV